MGLLLLAGGYYLWQVKLAVESSLPTALRDYTRRQADLDLQVARITLGLTRLRIWEIRLDLPDGSPLISARYAELRYPRGTEPLTLIIEQPQAQIRRDARGVWNIDPLLRRPPAEEPTQFAFILQATDGTLDFADDIPDPPVRQTIRIESLRVVQPLQALYAQATASTPDLGTIQAEALSDGVGWLIDLRADRVKANRLLGYLRLPDLEVVNAQGTVHAQIRLQPDQPVQVVGRAQGVVEGARYRGQSIPYRQARFESLFTERNLSATIETSDRQLQAQGVVDWSGAEIRFDAQVEARGDDARALWRLIRQEEPLVGGAYRLSARLQGTVDDPKLVGTAQLARLETPEGVLRDLSAEVVLSERQLWIQNGRARYEGQPVQAKAYVDLRPSEPTFQLWATARNIPAHRLPRLRNYPLRAPVDGVVMGEGTLNAPKIQMNLLSDRVVYEGVRLGTLRVRLAYANGKLGIPFAILQGALGSVQVSGEVQLSPRLYVDMRIDADEVELNRVARLLGYTEGALVDDFNGKRLRLEGVGYATLFVRGTPDTLEAVGDVAVFDGRLGDIGAEILVGTLSLYERELTIPELRLLRRTSEVVASGRLLLPERTGEPIAFTAQAEARDLDLSTIADWTGEDIPLSGLASATLQVSGTTEQFAITGEVRSNSPLIDQVKADEVRIALVYDQQGGRRRLELPEIEAQIEKGRLIGSLRWEIGTELQAEWALESFPISTVKTYLPEGYLLAGTVSGRGEIRAVSSEALTLPSPPSPDASGEGGSPTPLSHSVGEGLGVRAETPLSHSVGEGLGVRATGYRLDWNLSLQADDLSVNRAPLGTLRISLSSDDEGTVQGEARLESPEGTLQLSDLRYEPDTEHLQGIGRIDALQISWARQVVSALPLELPAEILERTTTLQGTLSAEWNLNGTIQQPQIALSAQLDAVEWRETNLGTVRLEGNWVGTTPPAEEEPTNPYAPLARLAKLRTERATLDSLRWQSERALLQAQAEYQNEQITADLDLKRFPLEWVRLWNPSLPQVDGTLDLSLLGEGDLQSPRLQLSATLQNLTYGDYTVDRILFSEIVVEEGRITTEDALIRMRDYQVRLSGELPFRWSPFEIPNDEPIRIAFRLREQPLSILELALPVDKERTGGTVDATLLIEGTLNEPRPKGSLRVVDGSLALEALRTGLEQIGLQVEFDGQEARILQASAQSTEGGTIALAGTARLNEEKPVLDLRATLDGLTLNEPKLPVIGGSARGAISGVVNLAGDTEQPRIEGNLQVWQGFLFLPAEFETGEAGAPLPVNPSLNLHIATAEEFNFRNPNLDARMVGNLQIAGTLSALTMDGTFSIRGGALSLPTARLRLEPDSLVRVNYPYTTLQGETIARIDLDVRASTSVVASDFTGTPQRYRVELDIRGSLDDPERLQMSARSDPPGLSEQTILSLLGRGEVLTALARGADPADVFRQQLGDILGAQILPGLLTPLETGIAQAFDLEQFTLDYTGLQPASFYLVKNLFNGVGIAYRRSLAGGGTSYQVRLFYRLPFRNPLLQRLRVGFGFDERDNRFVFIEGTVLFR